MPKSLSSRIENLESQAHDEGVPSVVRKWQEFNRAHAGCDDRIRRRDEFKFIATLGSDEMEQYLEWSREQYGPDEDLRDIVSRGLVDDQ